MILRGNRGNPRAEINDRQEDNRVYAICSSDGCDGLCSKTIHEILQQKTPEGADAGLNHGRDSQTESLDQSFFM